jgi:hypothetical protein
MNFFKVTDFIRILFVGYKEKLVKDIGLHVQILRYLLKLILTIFYTTNILQISTIFVEV